MRAFGTWGVLAFSSGACLIGSSVASAQAPATETDATEEADDDEGPAEGEERPEMQIQSDPRLDRAARGLFEAGSLAFESGRYEDAVKHFIEAYELSARPLLLYNIASSYDRLRQDAEALDYFQRYLEAVPDASNRGAVEVRVRLLEEAVERERQRNEEIERQRREEQARQQTEAQASGPRAAGPAGEVDDEGGRGLSPVYFYVGAGLTAVAGGLTVWSGLNTLDYNDYYEELVETRGVTREQGKEAYDEGRKREKRTNALIGVTAVLGVATVALAIFGTDWGGSDDEEPSPEGPPTVPTAWFDGHGFGVGVDHAF